MNPFAACVILCQVSFDKFLGMVPEERVARFGPHVGYDRMVSCLFVFVTTTLF